MNELYLRAVNTQLAVPTKARDSHNFITGLTNIGGLTLSMDYFKLAITLCLRHFKPYFPIAKFSNLLYKV
jgi:hypothetical protein